MRRDGTEIGQHAETPRSAGKAVLHRLARIVGYGNGEHLDITELQLRVGIEAHHILAAIEASAGQRAVGQIHRHAAVAGQGADAAAMVAVLVGYQDGVDTAEVKAPGWRALLQFAQREKPQSMSKAGAVAGAPASHCPCCRCQGTRSVGAACTS
jgi:hypothetical protein